MPSAGAIAGSITLRFPGQSRHSDYCTRGRLEQGTGPGATGTAGEAIGEVAIPRGRQVRLELSAAGRADLSPLRRLRADDLCSIRMRNADLGGDALAAIAHLTGLEEVNLLDCPIGDLGAKHLAGLPRLKVHWLGSTDCAS